MTVLRTGSFTLTAPLAVASRFVIGEDGERIVVHLRYNDGDTRQFVYPRQY